MVTSRVQVDVHFRAEKLVSCVTVFSGMKKKKNGFW